MPRWKELGSRLELKEFMIAGKYPVKKKEAERGALAVPGGQEEEERNFMEYQYGQDYSKEAT